MGVFYSCGNKSSTREDGIWQNTSWQILEGENIQLRLPNELKRSSRFRIKEDLPALAGDTSMLRLIQNSLEVMEYEDAEIDVFVDTSQTFRLIIISNTEKIDFTGRDIAILKKSFELENIENQKLDSTLLFGEIEATMKANTKLTMARFTNEIREKLTNATMKNSIYYLTGPAYTLVVYEYADSSKLVEDYLWSLK